MKVLPALEAVYVFGSRANETATKESDFDIAFLTGNREPISKVEMFNLQEMLAGQLNADVDLINLASASLVLQFEITSQGQLLFVKDGFNSALYESRILSMYQRFNVEREPILKEIIRTAKIYGDAR